MNIEDNDVYKERMSNFIRNFHPDDNATFSFINRINTPLQIDEGELRERLDDIERAIKNKFEPQEYYPGTYYELKMLDGQLSLNFYGPWHIVTWWEVPALSIINELHFREVTKDMPVQQIYNNGIKKFEEKAKLLSKYPKIKFADFGTRRRFSKEWHKIIIELCKEYLPDNFIGTSNMLFAKEFDIPVIGTMAHECFMGYSRLFGNSDIAIRDSHHIFLQDWWKFYGEEYSIALTDTFGSDFFFHTFTPEQARNWKGLRQDSGNPFAFAEKAINFYKKFDIDPREKTIIFSDSLNFHKMIEIWEKYHDKINVTFGIGTNLTNDMARNWGTLSIVIKMSEINGLGTVKLSDDPSKTMGDAYNVDRFKYDIFAVEADR